MKTPPFLLGATVIFWGWQTGFLWVGAVLGALLEAPRFIKARWDVSDEDFGRIWIFCSVLFLGAAVYSFTSNEGPSKFGAWLQNPNGSNQSSAGKAGAETATSLFRWLPVIFFLFVAAQAYSPRREISLAVISRIVRRWWKTPPGINVAYPYFAVCLYAASNHPGENSHYFWGLCALMTWALWTQRTRRFGLTVWIGTLVLAVALGYASQRGIGRLQNVISNLNPPEWMLNFLHPTNFDPTESETSLGQIGRVKVSGQIVIRLDEIKGSAPTYLRAATYRSFKGRRWFVDDAQKAFSALNPESDGHTWVLLPGKTNAASVKITSYLYGYREGQPSGLLTLPEGCSRIGNLPSAYTTLQRNGLGAVLAEGPGLVQFQASHGPGLTMDAPFNPGETISNAPSTSLGPGFNANPDLNVTGSSNEQAAVAQVVDKLGIRNKSPVDKLGAIKGFFQDKFIYSTWQEPPRLTNTDETPLSRFLLRTHKGHCEYFATATVLLLREAGIPARYAVGYVAHETSGDGYVVRQRDGHAWCIAWNGRTEMWENFDTTPASWVAEESKRASPMEWLSDLWSWIKLLFAKLKLRWGQTQLRQYLLWGLAPLLGVLSWQILFRRKKRKRGAGAASPEIAKPLPGMDSEFYQVEKKLIERGVARRPNETFSAWLEDSTKDPALAQISKPLRELLSLHYRCRFDPRGLAVEDREVLRRGTNVVLEALEKK